MKFNNTVNEKVVFEKNGMKVVRFENAINRSVGWHVYQGDNRYMFSRKKSAIAYVERGGE